MKKSQVLFLMISLAAMTLIGRDVFDRYAFPNIAHAQSTQPAQSGAQNKWEYCELVGSWGHRESFGNQVYSATIRYYQPSGWRTEMVELELPRVSSDGNAMADAKAIAKLGLQGWEMVQDRTSEGTTTRIYFKRPK